MVFQTKNNVPEIYTKASRDFQLISSAFDCIYNTLINNQLKLNYLDNLETVDAKMLDLIKNYLGFFTDQYYPEELLRSILINFPSAIKYKGSLQGIQIAIEALQNAYTDITYVSIKGEELPGNNGKYSNSNFSITTDGVIINQSYVDELLKYVLPIGAIVDQILIIQDMKNLTPDNIGSEDKIVGLQIQKNNSGDFVISQIRSKFNEFNSNYNYNYFLSKVGQTPIVKDSIVVKKNIGTM